MGHAGNEAADKQAKDGAKATHGVEARGAEGGSGHEEINALFDGVQLTTPKTQLRFGQSSDGMTGYHINVWHRTTRTVDDWQPGHRSEAIQQTLEDITIKEHSYAE